MPILKRLKTVARRISEELDVYRRVLAHPKTPTAAKVLLWIAIAYLCLPFDLIPDWIPVLGFLDDVLLVPALVWIALRLVPRDIVAACRRPPA
jgi:uncharacterized membrane protein YkvA (DUF1232 family)